MDKLEQVIKKSLTEQGTLAKAMKMVTDPVQGTAAGDPMAHLAAAAGKSVPAMSTFSKEIQKAQGADKYYNPAYDSKSAGLKPITDFATMNKSAGVVDGMMPPWKNTAAYAALVKLGGRPFMATKAQGMGNLDVIPFAQPDIESIVQDGKQFAGGIIRGVQVAMYNHPERQVGMMVYFYETPNKMYFAYNIYGKWTYVNWSYEAGPGGEPRIWLMRGGRKEGWLTHRGTAFTGEAIFVKTSDPGLSNIMKSDYIQDLRNYTNIDSLFKNNYTNNPTIISFLGRDWNLTALADQIQSGFDWAGILIPPLDIINAVWYISRGRYFESFLSIIALIPGVGDAIAVIFRPFVKLFNSAARGSKAIWKTLLEKATERNISPDVILNLFPGSVKFIQTAKTMKLLSAQQADDMLKWLDESKGFIVDFMKQSSAAKALAKNKALQKSLSKRLGYEYTDETIVAAKQGRLRRAWNGLKGGFRKLANTSFSKAARSAFNAMVSRSTNYWKSAYTLASKQFTKILYKDTKKLALCIMSFGDTAISTRFTNMLIDSMSNILTKNNGKFVYQKLNSRGIGVGPVLYMTPQQLRRNILNDLPTALEQLLIRSQASYKGLVDSVVAVATKPGEVINGYWTVFWTDPLRRFVNEYSGGRLTSVFSGGLSGTYKNIKNDIADGAKQFFVSQDFLKRVDIVYNELQEFLERADYGTEQGSKLNQQSVIFEILDTAWTELYGTPIIESLREANVLMKKMSPTLDYIDKVDNENIVQGDLDSLNFQAVISDMPGAPGYKLAYWKKLVDSGKVKYQGGNSGMWTAIKDDAQNGLKKGDVYQIDKKGRVTKVGSLQ